MEHTLCLWQLFSSDLSPKKGAGEKVAMYVMSWFLKII